MSTRTLTDIERDVDLAVDSLFERLDDITYEHLISPKKLWAEVERRGLGEDGYRDWVTSNDEEWV